MYDTTDIIISSDYYKKKTYNHSSSKLNATHFLHYPSLASA